MVSDPGKTRGFLIVIILTNHRGSFQGREPEACNNNNINLFKTRLHRPENNPDLVVEDPSTMQIKPEVATTRAGASKE